MLRSYLPAIVFVVLGAGIGALFSALNGLVGVKGRATNKAKADPYECGLPSDVKKSFRFGISFYLVAMLFILFDIEVVFLYPIGVILESADSVFVLGELIVFVVLLMVAFVYVWRKGALNWK